jgi:hypothetical protein
MAIDATGSGGFCCGVHAYKLCGRCQAAPQSPVSGLSGLAGGVGAGGVSLREGAGPSQAFSFLLAALMPIYLTRHRHLIVAAAGAF